MRKSDFELPNGMVYLDGNSLGPMPKGVSARLQKTVHQEWSQLLIKGWNEAGWMQQPALLGDRIAPLIGAPSGSVMVGDTLSIKIYQALAAALAMRSDRRVIVSDSGNFPSDLYMAEGLIQTLEKQHELRVVAPESVMDALNESVAVLLLTQADYRTGRLHDMQALTKRAHDVGAVVIWDLAHTAGALPIDLTGCNAEFAAGCTYKYLNAGPGAPAFIYVRPDIINSIEPALSGWLGHAAPFDFSQHYQPGQAIERMRVGTPPVLQMAALEAALDIWDKVSITQVRKQSIVLSELFIQEVEGRCAELTLISPRDPMQRGSQVSFAFDEGYAAIQALVAEGVVGDFRAPNVMRFGFTPLYLDEADVRVAVDRLAKVMENKLWAQERFQVRKAVT